MKNENGVSLIESLLVVVMVGIIVILLANLPNALGLVTKSQHVSLAREIASKQLEDKRAISFSNLVNDTFSVSDTRINLLPQGSGSVTVADCEAAVCTGGESVKKISVSILWKDRNINQSVTLTTLIGEGGINQ